MRIGQNAGWEISDEAAAVDEINNETQPIQTPEIQLTKYGNSRFFAIYIDGELLCVTVYKKGAMEVQRLLQQLWGIIQDAYGGIDV